MSAITVSPGERVAALRNMGALGTCLDYTGTVVEFVPPTYSRSGRAVVVFADGVTESKIADTDFVLRRSESARPEHFDQADERLAKQLELYYPAGLGPLIGDQPAVASWNRRIQNRRRLITHHRQLVRTLGADAESTRRAERQIRVDWLAAVSAGRGKV